MLLDNEEVIDTVIIGCSGYASNDEETKCLNNGMQYYL